MRIGFIAALVILGFSAFAQEESENTSKAIMLADFTMASSGSSNVVALSAHRMHPIAFKKRFYIGYGLRFSGYYGQDNGYVTAPASVSEGNFFKKQNEAKLDTLYMSHSSLGSINAAIYLGYKFTDRIWAEFNIDAVGYSFGANRTGRFEALSQGLPMTSEGASVTPFNLLLTGDYDIGSLNSEISGNFLLTDNLSLRAGLSFMFAEFTTENKLAFGNDRFRKKSLMPLVGVSWQF